MSVTKIILISLIGFANCRIIDLNDLVYINSDGSFHSVLNPDRFGRQIDQDGVIQQVDLDREKKTDGSLHLALDREETRVRRQAPNPGVNAQAAWPIAGDGGNTLTGLASVQGQKDGTFKAASAGVRFDHENGHAATLSGTHIPGAGNELTGAGKLNLINTNKHQLDANAFLTHTMPLHSKSFNTYGGGLDYVYDKKLGAGLGVQHSNFMDRTDYSAIGKWNVFKEPKSSLDLTAGFQKSTSPYFPSSPWNPSIGGIYRF